MALFAWKELSEAIDDVLQRIILLVIAALVAMFFFKRLPPVEEEPADKCPEILEPLDEVDGVETSERESEVLITSENNVQSTAETEIIEDEMQRQLRKCTCAVPLRMHRVAGGKYRMSDSCRLCLVRILRSTVMVRVGGGWDTLEHFLSKHDPCRVRLTNLGSGFSGSSPFTQHMVQFKSKQPVR